MAFVVEDGTGKVDANSYVTVEEADAYFADRGNSAWDGSDAAKQVLLVQATDYVELRFADKFIGYRTHDDQALSWPRSDTGRYADDEIPTPLKRAVFEYAVRAKSGPLAPDLVVSDSGYAVTVSKSKVGPLETEYEVADSGGQSQPHQFLFRPYPGADALVRPLLRNGFLSGGRVIR